MHSSYYTRFLVGLVLPMILGGAMSSATVQEPLPQSDESNSGSIVINMESYVYSPSEITVAVGKPFTLTLNNASFLVPHNFLLDDPNGVRILDADISSGESQTHTLTLTELGIYPFYCDKQLLFFPTHREEGMEGRLIVQ
jgi:plastocyanin